MIMIFFKWLWRTLIFVSLGCAVWWVIYLCFQKNITSTGISFILSEVASATFAGAFGALIYSKYIELSKLYFFTDPRLLTQESSEDSSEFQYLKYHFHNVTVTKGVDLFFFAIPFVAFFVQFGTGKPIIFGKSEIVAAFLIGIWVALGFNSMFIQGMFRVKIQQSMQG